MRWVLSAAVLMAFPAMAEPRLDHLTQVPSQYVIPRDVVVFVPDQCQAETAKCKVVYMMDGQNLFTPSSYSGTDWGVADALPKLIAAGKVPPTIVVGVNNIEARTREYMPQGVYAQMPADYQKRIRDFEDGEAPNADNFLKFLVTELKPQIERTYHVAKGPENTAIIGSSMGGHIALYAQGQCPDVFGASASLSMPWLMASPAKTPAEIEADAKIVAAGWQAWLKTTRMTPGHNRIYSDQGTVGLDGLFTPYEEQVAAMFIANGWTEASFQHPVYDGAEHSEKDWRKRIEIPLIFLLNP